MEKLFYPNKKKLLVTILVFIFTSFIPLIPIVGGAFIVVFVLLTPIEFYMSFPGSIFSRLILFLIQLFVSYYVSCIIYNLYNTGNFFKLNKYKLLFTILLFASLLFIPLIGQMPLGIFYLFGFTSFSSPLAMNHAFSFSLILFLFQLILSYSIICIVWKIRFRKKEDIITLSETQDAIPKNKGVKIVTIVSLIIILFVFIAIGLYSWDFSVKRAFGKEAIEESKVLHEDINKHIVEDFLSFTEYKYDFIGSTAGRALNIPFEDYIIRSIQVTASPAESDFYYQKLFSDKSKWASKREETENSFVYKFYKTKKIEDMKSFNKLEWNEDGNISSKWINNYAKSGDSFGKIEIKKDEKLIDIKVFIVDDKGLEIVQNFINRKEAMSVNEYYDEITESNYLQIPEEEKWELCFQIKTDSERQECYSKIIIATNPDTRVYPKDLTKCDLIKDERIKKECAEIYKRIDTEKKAYNPHRYESTNLAECDSLENYHKAICYSFVSSAERECGYCDKLDSEIIIEIIYFGNRMEKTEQQICKIYCEAKDKMGLMWTEERNK